MREHGNYSSMQLRYHYKVCIGCVPLLNPVVVSQKAACWRRHWLLIMSLFCHVLGNLTFCSGYCKLLRVLYLLSGEFFMS